MACRGGALTVQDVAAWTGRARAQARGHRVTPHLVLIGVILIWSGNAVAVKLGVQHVTPLAFTAARFAIGAALMAAVTAARDWRQLRLPPLRYAIPAALLGIVLNQVCFTYGLYLGSAVHASLIMGLAPILTAVFLFVYVRRRPPLRQVAALGLGFAGVVFVVAGGGPGGQGGSLLGDLICIGAPASWAVYLIIAGSAARTVPGNTFMTWTMLFSLVALGPLAFLVSRSGAGDWMAAAGPLLYASLAATAVAYSAYFWALPRLGVARTALYSYMQPALGAALAAALLGEPFGVVTALGAAAILVAAYLGNWRRAART